MKWLWILLIPALVFAQDAKEVKQQVKTSYDSNGRPINQGFNRKGFHRVYGTVTLVGGVDTVTLNTSTADGKQDISFYADSTYSGRVWSTVPTDTAIYSLVPLSGTQFKIIVLKASAISSTATVRYVAEGE